MSERLGSYDFRAHGELDPYTKHVGLLNFAHDPVSLVIQERDEGTPAIMMFTILETYLIQLISLKKLKKLERSTTNFDESILALLNYPGSNSDSEPIFYETLFGLINEAGYSREDCDEIIAEFVIKAETNEVTESIQRGFIKVYGE